MKGTFRPTGQNKFGQIPKSFGRARSCPPRMPQFLVSVLDVFGFPELDDKQEINQKYPRSKIAKSNITERTISSFSVNMSRQL